MLKKVVTILFITVFVASNTTFGELLKLPVLVHHFLEHVDLNGNESFANFISEHYAKEIQHPDDVHGDHGKLPFKTVDNGSSCVTMIAPQAALQITLPSAIYAVTKKIAYNQQVCGSSHLNSIWQPPRLS